MDFSSLNTLFNQTKFVRYHLYAYLSSIPLKIREENPPNFGKNSFSEYIVYILLVLTIAFVIGFNAFIWAVGRRRAKRRAIAEEYAEINWMLTMDVNLLSNIVRCGNEGDGNQVLELSERILVVSEMLTALQNDLQELESSFWNYFNI